MIRGLDNWGVFSLPRPISRAQTKYREGHYFLIRYDASAKTHEDVRQTMRFDPRVIRAAHVKLGNGKLETMARFGAPSWDKV